MFEVRGKLYLDSTKRRTSLTLGSYLTVAEAAEFIVRDYQPSDENRYELVEGEELTIVAVP